MSLIIASKSWDILTIHCCLLQLAPLWFARWVMRTARMCFLGRPLVLMGLGRNATMVWREGVNSSGKLGANGSDGSHVECFSHDGNVINITSIALCALNKLNEQTFIRCCVFFTHECAIASHEVNAR